MSRALWVAIALAATAACGEAPGKAWLVDRPRVLGARIEAIAEPARASLVPGERARITWLVPAPGPATERSWAFAACVAPEGNFASPRCEAPALAFGSGAALDELVAMDLEAPTAFAVGEAKELLVVAAFCEGAAVPALEPRGFTATCPRGDEPLLASTKVRLASAGPNRNPVVADDALGLPASCVAPGSGELSFTFRFRGDEREEGESILLSHVVTGGELDRLYSAFDPTDPAPKEVAIPWKPPETEGDVRSFFVLRDGRGGTTFLRRTVCVRR